VCIFVNKAKVLPIIFDNCICKHLSTQSFNGGEKEKHKNLGQN
jgi:hypothetical protein